MADKRRFTDTEMFELDHAVRLAEQATRFEFSVFVGGTEGDCRLFAEARHRELLVPGRSVLVLLDPARRRAEIVTGDLVQARISDVAAARMLVDLEHLVEAHSISRVLRILLARLSADTIGNRAAFAEHPHSL